MSLNILLVDDSDVIRTMISRTLSLANLEVGTVLEAANGREALKLLGEEWVDLVLADINMPVMDGAELIDRMNDRPHLAGIPVIVVTTEGASQRVEQLMAKGVAAWVRKPFTPEEIRDVIVEVTSNWDTTLGDEAIDGLFGEVLGTFAFALPEPIDTAQVLAPGDEIICATIAFEGAVCGVVSVLASSSLCRCLAANVLGTDDEDRDAVLWGADTLGEIVNIVAGHLVTRVEPRVPTRLQSPEVTRATPASWERLSRSASTRAYVIEDSPVLVTCGLRRSRVIRLA